LRKHKAALFLWGTALMFTRQLIRSAITGPRSGVFEASGPSKHLFLKSSICILHIHVYPTGINKLVYYHTVLPVTTLRKKVILAFDKRSAVDKRITDVGGGSPAAPGLGTVLSAYVKIIVEQ